MHSFSLKYRFCCTPGTCAVSHLQGWKNRTHVSGARLVEGESMKYRDLLGLTLGALGTVTSI